MNRLLFGDNLKWLRDTKVFPDASVDLVYLDPPFNSNANYNVLFKEASGESSQAQFHAFTDTWEWTREVDDTYRAFVDTCPNAGVVELVEALKKFLKTSPMMAYLAMMAPRLVELQRVLKPTGSLYLHCDPTASHYLRLVLDSIFGAKHFENEIIWKRTSAHSSAKRYGPIHDTLLFYSKSDDFTWTEQFQPYDQTYLDEFYTHYDKDGRRWRRSDLTGNGVRHGETGKPWRGIDVTAKGRHWSVPPSELDKLDEQGKIHWPAKKGGVPMFKRYADEMPGVPLQDVWTDIPPMHNLAAERLGFPTQKPQVLLERIITASCPKNGVVLDPFCGCGTTVHAAQKLGRPWIGIDVTYLAINLIKRRLRDAFGEDVQFEEMGQPTDFESAKRLAEMDKWQFQQWALSIIHARPRHEGEGKGADRGVDGLLYFYESKDDRCPILVQVKGGTVKRDDIATLVGDVNNQKAAGGVLITLEKPTKPMVKEAVEAGRYKTKLYQKEHPKIQILTVEGLLSGKERLDAPPQANPFAKAEREGKAEKQEEML
jgi:site-specific DNA-methyltransferase (adenine-specific)